LAEIAQLDLVNTQPPNPPSEPSREPAAPPPPGPPSADPHGWYAEPFETREIRKARERADRAARRADRAARRVRDAQERAAGQRSGTRQLVDAAGDAATAALVAVSAAADEAQARLAAKARMRELEEAVVTARAGGVVDVSTPTHAEALKLADRVDAGSPGASLVRALGVVLAAVAALSMIAIGGFGWLGLVVPMAFLMGGGSLSERIHATDRSRKARQIQLELARARPELVAGARGTPMALGATGARPAIAAASSAMPLAAIAERPTLLEHGDPHTRSEVMAVLERLIANVRGFVSDADMAALLRIRDSAALALPAADRPLDLTDHEMWLLRQICIDYLPGALEHYIALPADMASAPLLDGRSARQVLDEQLALIEGRVDQMATRMYQREAGGLLNHARFVADSLRPDPFQVRLAELSTGEAETAVVAAPVPIPATEASAVSDAAVARTRERA
jgi:hypothetical protein